MSGYGRISYSTLASSSLRGMQSNLARFSQDQEQLSSGRTINKPSDNPSGTLRSIVRNNIQ